MKFPRSCKKAAKAVFGTVVIAAVIPAAMVAFGVWACCASYGDIKGR